MNEMISGGIEIYAARPYYACSYLIPNEREMLKINLIFKKKKCSLSVWPLITKHVVREVKFKVE